MGKRKAQDSLTESETETKKRIIGIDTKLAADDPANETELERVSYVDKDNVEALQLAADDPANETGLEKVSHVDEDNVEVEEPLARDTHEKDAGLRRMLSGDDEGKLRDFSSLSLKKDHPNRPLLVCTDGRIFLETFAPLYKQAYDFLIAIAEPVCRPETMHEYTLTPHSLYAAVSVGLETNTILTVLERLSKTNLSQDIRDFVCASTLNYGKVKLVLQKNKFMVESAYPEVLQELLKDEVFQRARVLPVSGAGAEGGPGRPAGADGFDVSRAPQEEAAATLARTGQEERGEESAMLAVRPTEGAEIEAERELHSFEIDASQVEHVKQRCLPGGLNYPMLEEYDFRNDTVNPDLNIELKPTAKLRPYQEKGLSKMFGNGRARSGIIVLPCGAGKSLTAVAAASRVRKSALVLCTNSVSVDQWKHQFRLWTNLEDNDISKFTSQDKEGAKGLGGVTVSTYNMVAYTGSRSEASKKIIEMIQNREWGLLIMDEVHVVPANMFRKVIGIIKAHCKLGLTATLVREDGLISDLNFLIGPKVSSSSLPPFPVSCLQALWFEHGSLIGAPGQRRLVCEL
ncbi:General transcription and DNA repair factor IIH helicase subunit xpb1 [Cymbomonas tetramitiformis]|uniref:DNA 3'-5' helicase n=1 Tax=Cymbomonas tetramitiformis TaxID=36881 RepID=A0AAE0H335_9CHLO|nr:General transcription and DNA repair factor IIH helicase subunit xpb1 [Cymbomonas tetramitiformis]